MAGPGLYANIHAKRKRGGKMRKKGEKGAPTAANFRRAAQTARKKFRSKKRSKLYQEKIMPLGRTKRDAKKRILRQMDKAQKKFGKKLPKVKGKK